MRFTGQAERDAAARDMDGAVIGSRAVRALPATSARGPNAGAPDVEPEPSNDMRNVIFVHNLNSARTTDAALAEFFAAVGRVEAARVFQGQDSGFVRYTSQYDAARAMERLQGCVFNGKPLQLTSGQQVQAAYSQALMPASYLPPAGPLLAGMRYESEQTGGGMSVPGAAPTNPSSWDVSGWAPTTYGVLGQGALAGMTLPQVLILNQAYGMTPYQQQMLLHAAVMPDQQLPLLPMSPMSPAMAAQPYAPAQYDVGAYMGQGVATDLSAAGLVPRLAHGYGVAGHGTVAAASVPRGAGPPRVVMGGTFGDLTSAMPGMMAMQDQHRHTSSQPSGRGDAAVAEFLSGTSQHSLVLSGTMSLPGDPPPDVEELQRQLRTLSMDGTGASRQ